MRKSNLTARARRVVLNFNGTPDAEFCGPEKLIGIAVSRAGLDRRAVASLLRLLNAMFSALGVRFTAGSTGSRVIHVGASAQIPYLGLAEIGGSTGFVQSDRLNVGELPRAIAHEALHLLGFRHAVEFGTLADCALINIREGSLGLEAASDVVIFSGTSDNNFTDSGYVWVNYGGTRGSVEPILEMKSADLTVTFGGNLTVNCNGGWVDELVGVGYNGIGNVAFTMASGAGSTAYWPRVEIYVENRPSGEGAERPSSTIATVFSTGSSALNFLGDISADMTVAVSSPARYGYLKDGVSVDTSSGNTVQARLTEAGSITGTGWIKSGYEAINQLGVMERGDGIVVNSSLTARGYNSATASSNISDAVAFVATGAFSLVGGISAPFTISSNNVQFSGRSNAIYDYDKEGKPGQQAKIKAAAVDGNTVSATAIRASSIDIGNGITADTRIVATATGAEFYSASTSNPSEDVSASASGNIVKARAFESVGAFTLNGVCDGVFQMEASAVFSATAKPRPQLIDPEDPTKDGPSKGKEAHGSASVTDNEVSSVGFEGTAVTFNDDFTGSVSTRASGAFSISVSEFNYTDKPATKKISGDTSGNRVLSFGIEAESLTLKGDFLGRIATNGTISVSASATGAGFSTETYECGSTQLWSFGVYAKNAVTVQGDLGGAIFANVSGVRWNAGIVSSSEEVFACGIYAEGLIADRIAGTISASALDCERVSVVAGICTDKSLRGTAEDSPMEIAETARITSLSQGRLGLQVGIIGAGFDGALLTVSGMIFTGSTGGNVVDSDSLLAEMDRYHASRYDFTAATATARREAMRSLCRGDAINTLTLKTDSDEGYGLTYTTATDRITLNKTSVIWGNIQLSAGNNYLDVDSRAQVFGYIDAHLGTLNTEFRLRGDVSDGAVISSPSIGGTTQKSVMTITVDMTRSYRGPVYAAFADFDRAGFSAFLTGLSTEDAQSLVDAGLLAESVLQALADGSFGAYSDSAVEAVFDSYQAGLDNVTLDGEYILIEGNLSSGWIWREVAVDYQGERYFVTVNGAEQVFTADGMVISASYVCVDGNVAADLFPDAAYESIRVQVSSTGTVRLPIDNLTAAESAAGVATVSWSAIPAAVGYVVEYTRVVDDSGAADWTCAYNATLFNAGGSTVPASSINLNLEAGYSYYFRVSAILSSGARSDWAVSEALAVDGASAAAVSAPMVQAGKDSATGYLCGGISGDALYLNWNDVACAGQVRYYEVQVASTDASGAANWDNAYSRTVGGAWSVDSTGAPVWTANGAESELVIDRSGTGRIVQYMRVSSEAYIDLAALGLAVGSDYQWRVRAVDGAGNTGVWSSATSATLPPVSVAPAEVASLTFAIEGSIVTFNWSAALDAEGKPAANIEKYIVEYDTHADFSEAKTKDVTANQLIASGLTNYAQYFWRVKTVDRDGNQSDWVEGGSFKLYVKDESAPTAATGLETVGAGSTVTFRWIAAQDQGDPKYQSGINAYLLTYVASNLDFDDISAVTITVPALGGTSCEVAGIADGDYKWRLLAYDWAGNYANQYAQATFTVNTTPSNLTSTVTVDTETGKSNRVIFAWDGASPSFQVEYALNSSYSDSSVVTVNGANTLTVDGLADAVYYWRVRAYVSPTVHSGYMEGPTFTVDTYGDDFPPTVPSNPTISVDAANNDATFRWTASKTEYKTVLAGYELELATDETFTTLVISEKMVGTTFSVSGEILSELTTYYWRVRAFSTLNVASDWAAGPSFTTYDFTAPEWAGNPTVELSVGVNQSATFRWTAGEDPSGPITYTVQYATDGAFTTAKTVTVTDTSCLIAAGGANGLRELTTYYWRVSAADSAGNTTGWALGEAFTTGDWTAPTTPSAKGSIYYYGEDPTKVTLKWQESTDNSGDPVTYLIEISDSRKFTEISQSITVTDGVPDAKKYLYYTLENIELRTTYYWRVSAIDSSGNVSTPSSVKSFNSAPDAGNGFDDAFAMVLGECHTEEIGGGDSADYYKIDLTDGTAGEFIFTASAGALTLYSEARKKITYKSGDAVRLDGGVYYVAVKSSSSSTFTYDLCVGGDFYPGADRNNTIAQANANPALSYGIDSVRTDWVGYGDPEDYYRLEVVEYAGAFTLAVTSDSASKMAYNAENLRFALGVEKNGEFSTVKSAKYNKKTGLFELSGQLVAGTYYVRVYSADNGKKKNSNYTLTLSGQYYNQRSEADSNTLAEAAVADGLAIGRVVDSWVGCGDPVNYYKFVVSEVPGSYQFVLSDSTALEFAYNLENVKLQVGTVDSKGKFKSVGSAKYSKSTGVYQLDKELAVGTYYIKVYSADNGKKKNSGYELAIGGVRYTLADPTNNTAVSASRVFFGDAPTTGWVGYGDTVDYYELELADAAGCYTFLLGNAEDSGFDYNVKNLKFQLGTVNDKGTFKALASGKVVGDTVSLNDYNLKSGTYYLKVYTSSSSKNSVYELAVGGKIYNADNSDDTLALAQLKTARDISEPITDWVGFGDRIDYQKVDLTAGRYALTLTGVDMDDKLKLTLYDAAGSSLGSLGSSDILAGKSFETKGVVSGVHYVAVETTNEKKYMSGYSLGIALV